MDATQVKTKLIGYGFSLLEGIDPNPEVNIDAITILKSVSLFNLDPQIKLCSIELNIYYIYRITYARELYTQNRSKLAVCYG